MECLKFGKCSEGLGWYPANDFGTESMDLSYRIDYPESRVNRDDMMY